MHKRKIKVGKNKSLEYACGITVKLNEVVKIDAVMRGAYTLAERSLEIVCKGGASEFFEKIFGDNSKLARKKAEEAFCKILEKFDEGKILVHRYGRFANKLGEMNDNILSSASIESGWIRIYNAFFKECAGDEKNLNDRNSVIMHEVAHLAGLKEDSEKDSFKSAECLRNFALLANGIVNENDLLFDSEEEEKARKKLPAKARIGINNDLPYDPNQPRAPKGSSSGGQWVKGGGNGGNKASQSDEGNNAHQNNGEKITLESDANNKTALIENDPKKYTLEQREGFEKNLDDIKKILEGAKIDEFGKNIFIGKDGGKITLPSLSEIKSDEFDLRKEYNLDEIKKMHEHLLKMDFYLETFKIVGSDKMMIGKLSEVLGIDISSKEIEKSHEYINEVKSEIETLLSSPDGNEKMNLSAETEENALPSDDEKKNAETEEKDEDDFYDEYETYSEPPESGYKSESATIAGVDINEQMKDERVELEDAVKFGEYRDLGTGTWVAIGIKDKDESYTKDKIVPVIIEAEFEKDDSGVIEKTAVLFEEAANENGEVIINRAPILETYTKRDDLEKAKIKIKVFVPDPETHKELEVKRGDYNPAKDVNNKQLITKYIESHTDINAKEKKKEGKITNYDEIKKKGKMKEKVLYEREISIDMMLEKAKAIKE